MVVAAQPLLTMTPEVELASTNKKRVITDVNILIVALVVWWLFQVLEAKYSMKSLQITTK